ncbi:PAS domain-containing sensor histidine kinase [Nitrosospira sp. Nsp13]|uniref:hybrid sensor histidine kinase/response regulator n=1 Tax=Nitrosospira sp. Nsp13 TaxID=1855332 RepID=UPI000892008B|nr:PAS domain-containing sensor histidine kinase [Nitrosospira sp. Nsp13]SCY58222.1 PAS domain S-box-containing protein [Nitrosospira sp. Nsp13]
MLPSSPPIASSSEAERFHQFMSGVNDYAIFILSPEGLIYSWNLGAQRFKGYTADEIIGQHFSRFYTEEDQAINLPFRALKTALQEGKFEDEGWRVRKDGSRFWASVVIDPIKDLEGTLLGFAKITRDITERKQAADALRGSEEQFRLLVQGVTDYAIYMLSPDGIITNWNAGAQRIKGYDHNEAVGTHFSRFYTEEDRNNGLPITALKIAAAEGRFEGEGWRIRKDGSRFWAHVVIDPIKNDLGELIGYAKITRDITEKRQAMQDLEHAKEALFQSQKLEALGQLTGGIAHDFNNLLNVIVNGVGILAKEIQNPSSVKILESMQRSALQGAALTQQLLTFARKQPLNEGKYDLNRIISSFEAVLRRVRRGSISFDLKLDPLLPPAIVDVAQFEAALLNLVINARDAMPDRGVITLSTEQVELRQNQIDGLPAGNYVKVTVRDTGSGMSPEVARRATEPFFTTKEVGKGTGMGLSQVYGTIKQFNGDMAIETEMGKGTAISLFLPAQTSDATEELDEAFPEGNEKALVVDDQPDVLNVAIELFRSMGYDVLSANNGEDALEILKRTPDVDVLFSDIVMPGMSGFDLGHNARSLIPGIKVVLASGYAASAPSKRKNSEEDFKFIQKPYRMSEIVKMLRMSG